MIVEVDSDIVDDSFEREPGGFFSGVFGQLLSGYFTVLLGLVLVHDFEVLMMRLAMLADFLHTLERWILRFGACTSEGRTRWRVVLLNIERDLNLIHKIWIHFQIYYKSFTIYSYD